jgi:hypothetical protein
MGDLENQVAVKSFNSVRKEAWGRLPKRMALSSWTRSRKRSPTDSDAVMTRPGCEEGGQEDALSGLPSSNGPLESLTPTRSFCDSHGIMTLKLEPLLISLRTSIFPPRSSVNLLICRPNPTPPHDRFSEPLTSWNISKMKGNASSGIPIPVSVTRKIYSNSETPFSLSSTHFLNWLSRMRHWPPTLKAGTSPLLDHPKERALRELRDRRSL